MDAEFLKICIFVLATVYGLCVGSFLNVVIYRLPIGKKMGNERSICPDCGSQIKWYDNIPLVSYIVLGGKCRNCKKRISPRYPVIEASNMLLWLLSFVLFYDNLIYAFCSSICFSVLICVFMIDLKHKIIFDRFHIIILVLGLIITFTDKVYPWYSHIIGAFLGFVSFYLIRAAVSKMVGVEAMGFGDVKFAAVMGLFFGWEKFILSSLLSSLTACIVLAVISRSKKYEKNHEFPFGPFLCLGFSVSMLFGNAILQWYSNLFIF